VSTVPSSVLRSQLEQIIAESEAFSSAGTADYPNAFLDLLVLTHELETQCQQLLAAAVIGARHAGGTWEQIGSVLGVTRQAAQQHYGSGGVAEPGSTADAQLVKLTKLTAFTEVAALNRVGQYGGHSVGSGPGYHLVQGDTRRWQHARTWLGRHPVGNGWVPIGTGRGWWQYWARPTRTAAARTTRQPTELAFG